MRARKVGTVLKVKAIAGTHVVILGWDFVKATKQARQGLLGFAIEREERVQGGAVERYWLRGIKRFKDKDQGLAPGSLVPTSEHPVQGFQWGDYTAKPGTTYRYRIVPAYGKPKLLEQREASAVTVEVTTETEAPAAAAGTRHEVYFNRGVIGSQAYARRFENADPDVANPQSREMTWLSRGLYEALLRFIDLARNDRFALRAALYEFRHQPVANRFARAHEAGADVKIVYDDESSYKTENRATIAAAGLDQIHAVVPRTVTEGIRHNKFIVLLEDAKPVAVWTGSTNVSTGGIFGHSNVGHVVWDPAVAAAYLDYWERLALNLTPSKLVPENRAATPTPSGPPPKGSVLPLFSPRDGKDEMTTLQWYADRMAQARRMVCFTVAFNLDDVFQKVISQENDVLRYIVKDDDLGNGESIGVDHDVLFAAGGRLDEGALANFLGERGNPLNTNDYIHTKYLLVDPLGRDPLVVTGSANFSRPSQRINDENMLVIRGDTRVADIYFGEFMRIFDHHYARYIVKKLTDEGRSDPEAGYLKTEPEQWAKSHFDAKSYKSKRRRYFVEA